MMRSSRLLRSPYRLLASASRKPVQSITRAQLRSTYDVIVVGGGVIGCSVAFHAARAGASVLVVERRAIAAEQSSKSWGFCRQQGRDTRELPLMIESIGRWVNIEEELGASVGWQQGGNLMLFESEADEKAQRRWLEAARPHGVESQILDRAGVAATLPGVSSAFTGGLWTATDGTADPDKTTLALAGAAARHGADFLIGESVEALLSDASCTSRVRGVRIESREREVVEAWATVVATAGWTSEMIRPLGLRLPTLRLHATAGRTTAVDAPYPEGDA